VRFAIAACLAAMLAAALAAQTPPPAQQQPTFRTGVNFVRVDVYPTIAGRAVADLTKGEFQVFEDGLPQRIESFERINIRLPGEQAERGEPASVAESNDAAADPRNRVFVLFLDTYHTPLDRRPDGTSSAKPSSARAREAAAATPAVTAGRITRALSDLLEHLIGPDDLVGVFMPEMPVHMLTFTRRPASIEEILEKAAWQRYFSDRPAETLYDLDEREMMYRACYVRPEEDGLVNEMIARRREMLVLGALRNLITHLQNIRDDRKAILLVSPGWHLFGPSSMLAAPRDGRLVPAPPPVGVSPRGQPTIGETNGAAPLAECDRDRAMLAALDDARDFREILNAANRANVTFYPIDPSGLVPGPMESRTHDTLRQLASVTDGIAVVDTNEIDRQARRIVDDMSSYYLIGYSSTNMNFDGKFRTIAVRVKRPGVIVRARRGYLAPTEAEVAASKKAATSVDAEEVLRDRALSLLGAERTDQPVRVTAGHGFEGAIGTGSPLHPALWVVGEMDTAAMRAPEWAAGGDVTIAVSAADGRAVAAEQASITPAAPRFAIHIPNATLTAGDYLVKVRVRGRSGPADAGGQVRVGVPDVSGSTASVLGQPMLFRRGPYSGTGYQPTADLRFRKAERIRVDLPLGGAIDSSAAQLLDRKGQVLPIPVTTGQRDEGGRRFLTAEVTLAPLAPADYLVEVSVRRGEKTEKKLTAFRIVP